MKNKNKQKKVGGSGQESPIQKNKKEFPSSFYSITEKQEESKSSSSSSSSNKNSKLGTPLISENSSNVHFIKFNNDVKELNNELSLKSINRNKYLKQSSLKSFKNIIKDNNININEGKYKKYLRQESQKKIKQYKNRISFTKQQNLNELNIPFSSNNINIKPSFIRRNSSTKNASSFQLINNYTSNNISNSNNKLKGNRNSNLATFNHKIFPLFGSPIKKPILRNKSFKSFNLSNSTNSNINIYSNHQIKNETLLSKKKIKINDDIDYSLQKNLFQKLKNSPMFEKSENIIFREKIVYGLLAFCTLMSVLFQIIDSLLYNRKSKEFLEKIHKKKILKLNRLSHYKKMEERKISGIENAMRILNIIFNFFYIILSINIYIVKNKFIKQTNKNNKNFLNYYNSTYFNLRKKRYIKTIKEEEHVNIVPNDDELLLKKKLPKSEIIKTIIDIIINLIFYPPSINKVFISQREYIITIYSLNSLLLILSIFKLINLYRAIIHLSPLNSLIYKTICKSKMIKMDSSFMSKFFFKRYPKANFLINFILNSLTFCILILCIEYFAMDIKKGIWNNKGNNNLKNIYNTMYIYLFYVVKMAFGDVKPMTVLGCLLMIIIGFSGLMITCFFAFYFTELINLNPEEKKAYTKLKKIFNPLNSEHKASNLIRFFIFMIRSTKEFENLEKNYINKKKNRFKDIVNNTKFNIFNFKDENEIYNNLTIIVENNMYQDKFEYEIYLCRKFLLRVKILSECNIFKNKLLIARNFSNSFTELLKNLGHKINQNLNIINTKLQILKEKEKKYNDFMKFDKRTMKKLKKIKEYQQKMINYLINKNNNNYDGYLNEKRKIRKSKGITGSLLYKNKKLVRKIINNEIKRFEVNRNPIGIGLNRIGSSIMSYGRILNLGNILYSKTNNKNENIEEIKRIDKSKTLDLHLMKHFNIIKKSYMFGFGNENKNKKRYNSCNFKNNKIIVNIKKL